jgi:hypothetical protein
MPISKEPIYIWEGRERKKLYYDKTVPVTYTYSANLKCISSHQ